MWRPQLTLVPIGSPQIGDEVRNTLSELGYPTRLGDTLGALEQEQFPASILVLLLGSHAFPHTHIESLLRKESRPPALGIFDRNVDRLDPSLVHRCDEFVCWPCHDSELEARIRRLSLPDVCSLDHQPELARQFMSLNLVGRSAPFLNVLEHIKRIAPYDAPLLIEGETGTGKELAARATHYLSARKDYPFIPVNCGAVPDNLIENELFGHQRGAYTDAKRDQAGLVAQAEGGTLFLDEIDSLTAKAQVTLLRFLQDQCYLPLGCSAQRSADLRIIAATSRPLDKLVEDGEFRQDLYFRINVMLLRMPPLRERSDDAALLAQHFVRRYQAQYDQPNKTLHPEMLHWISRQSWAGNVRELENFIQREFLLAEHNRVGSGYRRRARPERRTCGVDRRLSPHFDLEFQQAKAKVVDDFEKRYLAWLLSETRGNVTRAARQAGKERRALGKLLKKHRINRHRYER